MTEHVLYLEFRRAILRYTNLISCFGCIVVTSRQPFICSWEAIRLEFMFEAVVIAASFGLSAARNGTVGRMSGKKPRGVSTLLQRTSPCCFCCCGCWRIELIMRCLQRAFCVGRVGATVGGRKLYSRMFLFPGPCSVRPCFVEVGGGLNCTNLSPVAAGQFNHCSLLPSPLPHSSKGISVRSIIYIPTDRELIAAYRLCSSIAA